MEITSDLIDQKSTVSKAPQFHKLTHHEFSNLGVLELGDGTKIQTPMLWFGLSVVESVDFQLEVFRKSGVEAFLSNVYDLLIQDKKNKRFDLILQLKANGLHHKIDSGGFQLMKSNIMQKKLPIKLTPELVYEKQKAIGGDIAVQLDVPLSPSQSPKELQSTIETTVSNFVKLKELNESDGCPLNIMPVAHGYTPDMLDYCIDKYEEVLGDIPIIGIGSLVPMVKSILGTEKIGGKWTFIQNLVQIRKRLPNTMIHAFGIGGTMSYLAFYCGLDSLDSNGWIQKSGYGVIQLPGVSDRFLIRKSHNRPFLVDKREYGKKVVFEKRMFMECNCPACKPFQSINSKHKAWTEKVEAFDQDGVNGRLIRSIHNVSVFNQELIEIRNAIKNNNLDQFTEDRLITSKFYKEFLYASALKNDDMKKAEKIRYNNNTGQRTMDRFLINS